MKKSLMFLSLLTLSTAAHSATIFECTPDQATTSLESVTVASSRDGAIKASVTVNVPFDNYISGNYNVSLTAPLTYSGPGFTLTLDPSSERSGQLAGHVDAHVRAQDGYPATHVRAKVACKRS